MTLLFYFDFYFPFLVGNFNDAGLLCIDQSLQCGHISHQHPFEIVPSIDQFDHFFTPVDGVQLSGVRIDRARCVFHVDLTNSGTSPQPRSGVWIRVPHRKMYI